MDVDAHAYGLPVTVMVRITLDKHTKDVVGHFEDQMKRIPEVLECMVMTGLSDYLLRVVVPDIAAYDRFYQRLINKIDITDVSSSFAMEQMKYTTQLPLDYLLENNS